MNKILLQKSKIIFHQVNWFKIFNLVKIVYFKVKILKIRRKVNILMGLFKESLG